MLATIEPTHNDFHALASYLIHGRDRPTHPDRVAWTIAQNLPTTDPLIAAKLMTATAELSRRCTNACYHVSINWHPDEQPTPEIMQDIARRTLDLAGLAEHQALAMGHDDKSHKHLHLMINRVHPQTGRAWSTSHDYRRFDRIMKLLSDEYGFLYVPGHAFEPALTDDLPKAPPSNARYAAKHGADTTRTQWSASQSRAFGERASERLGGLSGLFDQLMDYLDAQAFTLEEKGHGYVVGNETSYAKLSALGLSASARNGLTRAYRARRAAPSPRPRRSPPRAKVQAWTNRRSIFAVDAIDIARKLGTKADLQHAVQDAIRARKARLADKPVMEQLMEELKEQWRSSSTLKPPKPRPRPRRQPPKRGPSRSR